MGAYEEAGQTSHRFVHLVHDNNYVKWVGCWTHLGANHFLAKQQYDEAGAGCISMVDTHIFESRFTDGWVEATQIFEDSGEPAADDGS